MPYGKEALVLTTADEAQFERLITPLLRHFSLLLAELGGDLGSLLDDVGILRDDYSECSGGLTYRQTIRLLDTAARDLDCPDLGMRLAIRQRGGAVFGPLGNVMRNSKTFGDAVRFASENSPAHSRAARVWLSVAPNQASTFAGHELLLAGTADRAQAIEQLLLIGHLEALEMTGGLARARKVHFRHEPVSPTCLYRRNFGCDVLFGEPADGITFYSEDLSRPIVSQDEYAHLDMTRYIAQHFPKQQLPVDAEVRGLVLRSLAAGDSSCESVALALSLHPRTLRRRLREEGLSFQEVKDSVRQELTYYYLERTDLEFHEISEKLGFAEQSIFSRSCRRWFGKSPTRLKRKLRPFGRLSG